MQYRLIIQKAWAFAQANKSMMKWYALLPAIFSVLTGVLFITYQFYSFKKTYTASGYEINVALNFVWQFWNFLINDSGIFIYALIFLVIIGFFYIFYPTFAQGAMIKLISQKIHNEDTNLLQGVNYGLRYFLPMFEYHLAIRTFSVTAVIAESTFVLRNLGTDALRFLLPVFILIAIFGVFLTLLFTFVEWYIVLEKRGVFESMKQSAKLVFYNWQHTILILLLLFIIGIRVVINIVLVFFVPLIIFAGVGIFATVAFQNVLIFLGIILSVLTLYIAGYLNGTLTIFTYAVWSYVFYELKDKVD